MTKGDAISRFLRSCAFVAVISCMCAAALGVQYVIGVMVKSSAGSVEQQENDTKMEGARAAKAGISELANPYSGWDSRHKQWFDGYLEAKESK